MHETVIQFRTNVVMESAKIALEPHRASWTRPRSEDRLKKVNSAVGKKIEGQIVLL